MVTAGTYDGPHRRLRLSLHVEADDLEALADRLRIISEDLRMRRQEKLRLTSGGYLGGEFASGADLELRCDPRMTGDRYRDAFAAWKRNRQAAAS